MTIPDVAVLVGSLREASLSRKVALAISALAESRLSTQLIDIGGLLFVTPEYNRSIPGALKNAIDFGSRPKQLFDEHGRLTDASTRDFLEHFIQRYAIWIDTLGRAGDA